jgi:hypothetical protein
MPKKYKSKRINKTRKQTKQRRVKTHKRRDLRGGSMNKILEITAEFKVELKSPSGSTKGFTPEQVDDIISFYNNLPSKSISNKEKEYTSNYKYTYNTDTQKFTLTFDFDLTTYMRIYRYTIRTFNMEQFMYNLSMIVGSLINTEDFLNTNNSSSLEINETRYYPVGIPHEYETMEMYNSAPMEIYFTYNEDQLEDYLS